MRRISDEDIEFIRDLHEDCEHNVSWAVRMFKNELGPLTVHIRHPENSYSSNKIINKKRDQILFNMHEELLFLAHKFHKPIYNKYKYIDSITTGQYKSIQLVLAELEFDCGEEYIKKFK